MCMRLKVRAKNFFAALVNQRRRYDPAHATSDLIFPSGLDCCQPKVSFIPQRIRGADEL